LKCGAGERWRSAGSMCEELKSIALSQGGEEYPVYNTKKKG
jgi:hypothetical protein